MKEMIIAYIILIIGIFSLAWLFITYPPAIEQPKNPDVVWCEEHGGYWISSYRNEYCAFPPK